MTLLNRYMEIKFFGDFYKHILMELTNEIKNRECEGEKNVR